MPEIENDIFFFQDDHIDDHVDLEIQECLSAVPPQSFFMFAGAGSGKTRSLINALEYLAKEKGAYLAEHGKQVAIITYTNAACDEISRRLQYKPIFLVSTIHSFLWELIKNFQTDIRTWIEQSIEADISELQSKQCSGRGGKAALDRAEKIAKQRERLEKIKRVKRFSYNPNGENAGFNSLSHDNVVKMGSEFIATKEIMQQILVNKYPILLIDESQDTKKELVDALIGIYEAHKSHWAIGMFGDTMQKIYTDGKEHLDDVVPREWSFPVKVMNHRSSKRIVILANAIRKEFDDKEQSPRTDAKEGFIRLFIADSGSNKERTEKVAAQKMATLTKDAEWQIDTGYECLILEHHMAASRFSFSNLYTPLKESKQFDDALNKGEIAELSFLANTVSPLVEAHKVKNDFEVARILRKSSPFFKKRTLELRLDCQQEILAQAEKGAESLFDLWKGGIVPTCIDVLKNIWESGLFEVPERVADILDDTHISEDTKVEALKIALRVSFDEMERYAAYVSDQTRFATHQGVKGLEFPRVMVVLDDSEAKGFLFSYEKLFGAKGKTNADLKNEQEGKDTSIQRTARLFYVACTRAMDSLAVVVYSENPECVKRTALSKGWFLPNEVEVLNNI